jgi:hypothetical protein
LRVLDDLKCYGEEGPEHANLPQQERDPEGAGHGAPHRTAAEHSDEKKKGPKNEVDYKGQSDYGTEHNRDLPWVAKGPEYKRKPGCGSEHNLSLVGGAGHKHKRVEAEQDQSAIPRPYKVCKHRQEGRTKPQAVAGQGPAPSSAENRPVSGLKQKQGEAMQRFLTPSAGPSPRGGQDKDRHQAGPDTGQRVF